MSSAGHRDYGGDFPVWVDSPELGRAAPPRTTDPGRAMTLRPPPPRSSPPRPAAITTLQGYMDFYSEQFSRRTPQNARSLLVWMAARVRRLPDTPGTPEFLRQLAEHLARLPGAAPRAAPASSARLRVAPGLPQPRAAAPRPQMTGWGAPARLPRPAIPGSPDSDDEDGLLDAMRAATLNPARRGDADELLDVLGAMTLEPRRPIPPAVPAPQRVRDLLDDTEFLNSA